MKLEELKGVGKTRLAQLNSAGIFSIDDLVNYYPKKYYDFSNVSSFSNDNLTKIILASLIGEPKVVHLKGINFTTAKMVDSFGNVFNAVWYNQPFIKSVLKDGFKYYLYGKNSPKKANTFVVAMLKEQSKINESLLPVYKRIDNFASAILSSMISQALDGYNFDSIILNNFEQKYNLITLKDAYYGIHKPKTYQDYLNAKIRLDVEKLVPLAMKNLHQKIYKSCDRQNKYANLNLILDEFKSLLKFNLTEDQQFVINDILSDLSGPYSMNRLVQGEVGSGKTMVAFFGLYAGVKNGYQTAMIAPTEILAVQHYNNLVKTFSGTGIKIVHLSGSMSAYNKREALRLIKLGEADIVVGTHSVIGESVEFKNLGFAVVDEQHRFGVVQRAKLSAKGKNPDILVMSATPIPRSMALAIYGNLSLSIIKKCPFAKDITTNLVTSHKQLDMWKYILEKTIQGSKAFVVCAHIDDDEDDNTSATAVYEHIINFFGKENVGLLHGKLKKASQQKIMEDFSNGKYKVLVSTTIVEVGVDIPEAEIMVIASPERFGLATLHQLRGRVGRNGAKSHCFCLVGDIAPKSLERLRFFKEHSSGFDIAEYDYNNRGAGDIYGTSQHGISADFSVNLLNYNLAEKIVNEKGYSNEQIQKILEIAEKNYSKICNDIVLN